MTVNGFNLPAIHQNKADHGGHHSNTFLLKQSELT